MRINRFISSSGYCSRRKADQLIAEGLVTVNGKKATAGMQVQDGDRVTVNGQPVRPFTGEIRVVLAFHKPRGLTSTSDPERSDNLIAYVNYPRRIFIAGRLDRDSRGLVLLTDDGDLAHRITHSRYGFEKEYIVTVDREINEGFLNKMRNGVSILGQTTLPCKAWRTGDREFHLVLRQGLNRQIRRMCEALGYQVTDLIRTRIANVTLGSQPEGSVRQLSFKEIRDLEAMGPHKSGR